MGGYWFGDKLLVKCSYIKCHYVINDLPVDSHTLCNKGLVTSAFHDSVVILICSSHLHILTGGFDCAWILWHRTFPAYISSYLKYANKKHSCLQCTSPWTWWSKTGAPGADLGGGGCWVQTNPSFCWFIRLTGPLLLPAVLTLSAGVHVQFGCCIIFVQFNSMCMQWNSFSKGGAMCVHAC